MIVGIALHILEPEFDPRFRFMSEYALAAHGWLMTTTFFVSGLATFVVAVALRNGQQSLHGARIGFGLLAVGALFVCLAGVFKDSLPHLFASVVVFPSIVMGGVTFGMEFSAGCRVANDLPSNALYCSWNACRVLVHGRRCRDARIAAASFPFPIPIVAVDCHPPVHSGKNWRDTKGGSVAR